MNLKPFVFWDLFVVLFHHNKAKLLSMFVSRGREIKFRHPGSSVDISHNKCRYVVMLHLKINVGHCGIHVIVE